MNQRKAGVILSYISMGLNALIGFVYIPLLLAFLSKEQYGLYQLVGSMIAYLTIMDFGLANTTVRYYSRLRAAKDKQGQENLLATMLRLYGGISFFILIIGFLLLHILLPFYTKTLTPADILTAKYIYWIMLFNLAIIIPGNIFSAVIQAHEKFIFLRCANIANIVLQPCLVFAVLHFKANVVALVIVQTLCNLSLFTANAYYCFAKLKIRFHLYHWDGKFVKEILYFSFFIFLNAIMDQIYWKTGQLILGAVIGTVSVAIYSVAIQLTMAYMGFSANISGVFLPHLSALACKADSMPEINQIFIKVGRLQFYVVMLLFWGFCLFGKPFILLWVGESFLPAYTYTLLFFAALIIPLIQNTGILILQAKNKHAFRAVIFVIIALLNVALSIPLAKHYGALACATVTAGCLLLGQGLILNIYYKYLGIAVGAFWKGIFSIFCPMLIPVVLFSAYLHYIKPPHTVLILGANIVGFSVLYIVILWFFAFNSYEKELIKRPILKFIKK